MAKVEKKQFTVILPNTPGALANFSETLAKKGVNIQSIAGEGAEEHGVIRIVTDDIKSTETALKGNYKYIEEDIVLVKLKNRPGELAKMSRKLANAGININFLYVYTATKDEMTIVLSTDKIAATKNVLRL